MALLKASVFKIQIQGRNRCEVKLEGQKEAKSCSVQDLTYELLNLSSVSGSCSHSPMIQTIVRHPTVLKVYLLVCMHACKITCFFLTYVDLSWQISFCFSLFAFHSALFKINQHCHMDIPSTALATAWYSTHMACISSIYLCTPLKVDTAKSFNLLWL